MIIKNQVTDAILSRQTIREYKDIPLNDDQKQALVLSERGYIEKPDYDSIKAEQDMNRTTSKWQTSASDLD